MIFLSGFGFDFLVFALFLTRLILPVAALKSYPQAGGTVKRRINKRLKE